MKRLFLGIVAATLAYSGWWFYAAQEMRSGVEDWFADMRAAGWDADYADLTVRGFPSRTDVTLTNPSLRAPDGSIAWTTPFLQILGLSYKRGHVIVAWADSQTLQTDAGMIEVTSDGMRASVVHEDGRILRSNFEAPVLNLAGPDQTLAAAGVNVALEHVAPTPSSYRLFLSSDGLAMSRPDLIAGIAPESLATLRADMGFDLSDALTVQNFAEDLPQLTQLSIRTAQVDYGALTLQLAGDADLDSQGRATGELRVEAQNWRESLRMAEAEGHLPEGVADGLVDLLSLVASLNGNSETLDVTLGLDRGAVRLGPLPVGELPPLRWR
ncbi:DUF2125 domain-containing protein [Marivita hallyeonensis]|uniref:DUF2125 domain-containing protein n=1 Tax=Marivita hallyeonensis TaxID=996342 RepID=A0A1M5TFX2_9RHOB|nr:DUF2125 domain-containing protein [Marivita hallyeonensis]SHH49657.1 hypothetical protein SAMN05443551_2219 [Marivita hallyeonensis]